MSVEDAGINGVVRVPWPWFVVLGGAIALLAKLALSGRIYRTAREVVGEESMPPREIFQALLFATAVAHVGEALAAGRMARRRGLPVARWRMRTLLVGVPALRTLQRAPVPRRR